MLEVRPGGDALGARIEGIDLAQPLCDTAFATIVRALGDYGVVCFPDQELDAAALKRFSANFGTLEINVTGGFHEPGHPEVMILSNIIEDGRPLGLADAGQDWHTDMSYSKTVAYANVLHGIRIPQRDGRPPVAHPVFLRHPITGRHVLYANPGYTVRIEGLPQAESDDLLRFLFEHQLQPRYRHAHHWREGDVLMWDDLVTLHNAVPDYGPDEPRLIRRCQVMADRVFDPDFLGRSGHRAAAA